MKLLAVASSTTFAAEAATARRLADELMATHNISLGPGKPAGDTIEVRQYVPFAKGMRWEGIIAGALANLAGCTVFFNGEVLNRYTLVGTVFNLEVLEYMLHAVNGQRIGAWQRYKLEGGTDSFNKFCYGFAVALSGKIEAMVDAERLSADVQVLTTWYEQNVLGQPVVPVDLSMGRASSAAGMEAGGNASLHRGTVTGGEQKRIGSH